MTAIFHETHVCRDCSAEITLPYVKVKPSDGVELMSLALQRAGALSRSHMTYHDLARDVLAALSDNRRDLGRPTDCDCPGRSLNGHNDGCPRKEASPWA